MTNPSFWKCPVHGPAKANAWGCPECVRELREEAAELKMTMRFQATYCSQCGGEFGPGDSGFSHCSDHKAPPMDAEEAASNRIGSEVSDVIDRALDDLVDGTRRAKMAIRIDTALHAMPQRLQDEFAREVATSRRGPISDAVLPLNGALLDRQARIDALRGERTVLARWIAEALLVLSTLDEDSEDGGESLRMLRDRGDRLVKAVLHG